MNNENTRFIPESEGTKSLEYELNEDNASYTVVGCDEDETSLVIPSEYQGKPVRVIGKEAFVGCDNLEKVTIPDSITTIEDRAFFKCKNLQEAEMPKSVTSIGEQAFFNCTKLTIMRIYKSVIHIGSCAFYGCNNLLLRVDEKCRCNMSKFGEKWHNGNMRWVLDKEPVLPDVVDGVLYYWDEDDDLYVVLGGDDDVEEVIIPREYKGKPVVMGESGAFFDSRNLKRVFIPGTIKRIEEHAFADCCNLEELTIEKGVEEIGFSAFEMCDSLVSVTLPDSITTIENGAFMGDKLESVFVPKSVETIEVEAFYRFGSDKKLTIYVEAESKPEGWEEGWNGDGKVVWGYKNH